MSNTVHGGGVTPVLTQRVYYTGTDTLKEGYALCWNFDASDVTAENLTLSAGVDEECAARRLQVEKPSLNNCAHFAGVVNARFDGFVGPGYLEINRPGSVCNIWGDVSADHGSTGTGMNTGQMVTFTIGQYYFQRIGLPGAGSAIVLQDVDRATVNGLIMAELCTGLPSGGLQIVASTEAAAVISAGGVLCVAPFGVTLLDSTAMTTCIDFTADLTCCLVDADGGWIGQRKVFMTTVSTGTAGFAVTLSHAVHVTSSTLVITTAGSLTPTFSALISNLSPHVIDCRWTGSTWEFSLNASTTLVA